MELRKNTRQDWRDLYVWMLQGGDRTIEVTINTVDIVVGDVTNLRYCFPLANHLQRMGKISDNMPLKLNIHLGAVDQKQRDADKALI